MSYRNSSGGRESAGMLGGELRWQVILKLLIIVFKDWESSFIGWLDARFLVKLRRQKQPKSSIPLIVFRRSVQRVGSKVKSGKRALCPIEESCWDSMVARQKQPFPLALGALISELNGILFEDIDEGTFVLQLKRRSSDRWHELVVAVR
jgi:hypothetical protein